MLTIIKKMALKTLVKNKHSIQVYIHYSEKISISLVEQLNIIYDVGAPKNCLAMQRSESYEKNLRDHI